MIGYFVFYWLIRNVNKCFCMNIIVVILLLFCWKNNMVISLVRDGDEENYMWKLEMIRDIR